MLFCILLSSSENKNILLFTPDGGHKEFKGALNIRIHGCGGSLYPPAELLLVDPQGRMTGRQTSQQATFLEIPYSSYEYESIDDVESGRPGPVSIITDVRNPMDGKYVLKIFGAESRMYSLEIRNYDHEMNFSDAKFINIEIKKAEIHTYIIDYSSMKSTETNVTPPANIKKDV